MIIIVTRGPSSELPHPSSACLNSRRPHSPLEPHKQERPRGQHTGAKERSPTLVWTSASAGRWSQHRCYALFSLVVFSVTLAPSSLREQRFSFLRGWGSGMGQEQGNTLFQPPSAVPTPMHFQSYASHPSARWLLGNLTFLASLFLH